MRAQKSNLPSTSATATAKKTLNGAPCTAPWGGKPGLVVTSCTNMDTPKFKEIMGWLLAEAQSELVFKTKAGAVRQRDKLIGLPVGKLLVQCDSECP